MTIKELITHGKMVSEVEKILQHSVVNVGFLNQSIRDETQLTVHRHILTKDGRDELDELFSSLTKEFGTTKDSVLDITIVESAATESELCL